LHFPPHGLFQPDVFSVFFCFFSHRQRRSENRRPFPCGPPSGPILDSTRHPTPVVFLWIPFPRFLILFSEVSLRKTPPPLAARYPLLLVSSCSRPYNHGFDFFFDVLVQGTTGLLIPRGSECFPPPPWFFFFFSHCVLLVFSTS